MTAVTSTEPETSAPTSITPSALGRTVIARLEEKAKRDRRHLNGHRRVLKRPLVDERITKLRGQIADGALESERIDREISALRKRKGTIDRQSRAAAATIEAGEEQLVVAEVIDPDFPLEGGGHGARLLVDLADFSVVGLAERDAAGELRFPGGAS